MLPARFHDLPEGMFPRLRSLLDPLPVPANVAPLMCQIGEPAHEPPGIALAALHEHQALFAKYPPIDGMPALRIAIRDWLVGRFGLKTDGEAALDANRHVLMLNGTREGLYMLPQILMEPGQGGNNKPLIMMPNPFYQTYSAAALNAGADIQYLSARKDAGFLPDLDEPDAADWARCKMFILCSPSNPEGAMADENYYKKLFALKAQHGFTLVVDECYSELYLDPQNPPVGALAMGEKFGDPANPFQGLLVMHSLSKRSNLPGLRSGFVAGDADILKDFLRLRNYGGPQTPLPAQYASLAAWTDEQHVETNRQLYRDKFDMAEQVIGAAYGWEKPAGGMFLWLNVGDGEDAAKALWQHGHVRAMPGAYMARPDRSGFNPGQSMLRIAMTQDIAIMRDALERLRSVLG